MQVEEDLDQHQNQRASIQDRVHASFVEYKAHRHASSGFGLPSKHKHSHRSSIAAALEVAFEQGAANVKQEEEALFIRRLPLLYSGNVNQQAAFSKMAISEADIAAAVAAFVDIIRAPARDDLLVVIFVAAFMSDVACWCSRRRASPQERILWHCVPGYFCLVRAYLSAFKRMCQRRPRMPSATPTPSMTVGRVLSLLDGRQTDPWVTYWSTREIDTLMDAAGDVMRNERLVNVLVQAVLNGTNILDPTNVNYSFGLLQRLLEVAARSAIPLNGVVDTAAGKQSPRQLLDATFDVDSFMSAMRNALNSVHVQILLKVLTFLYNCIGTSVGSLLDSFQQQQQQTNSCGPFHSSGAQNYYRPQLASDFSGSSFCEKTSFASSCTGTKRFVRSPDTMISFLAHVDCYRCADPKDLLLSGGFQDRGLQSTGSPELVGPRSTCPQSIF